VEYRHLDLEPEGEREEVRQIFLGKGFSGDELSRLVDLVTSDRARWVRTMLTEEYGLPQQVRSPWRAAFATFSAFILCGLVPLLPFLTNSPDALLQSTILTGAVFFAIGSVKSRWSTSTWWSSGLSTFAVGAIAAGVAYAVGVLLRQLTHS
jgi:VIT1/CCC1 family predicted Fe2+/Mn2+ transporter